MAAEEEGPPVGKNGGWRPVPDPTVLTTELIDRATESIKAEFEGKLEVLRERLAGIDEATKLLRSDSADIPKQIEEKVGHLKELQGERFASVDKQFKERDTRQERESRDNKLAVDAAFAAQEKLAIAQQVSNAESIDKSERATAETIKTNQELNKATTDGLTKSLDEVKLQVSRIESAKQGAAEVKVESRSDRLDIRNLVFGLLGAAGVLAAIIFAIIAATSGPSP